MVAFDPLCVSSQPSTPQITTDTGSWDPKNVVTFLLKATVLKNPSPQYIVGMDGRFEYIPLVMLPIQMQVSKGCVTG